MVFYALKFTEFISVGLTKVSGRNTALFKRLCTDVSGVCKSQDIVGKNFLLFQSTMGHETIKCERVKIIASVLHALRAEEYALCFSIRGNFRDEQSCNRLKITASNIDKVRGVTEELPECLKCFSQEDSTSKPVRKKMRIAFETGVSCDEVSGQVQGTSTEVDKITNPHIVYSKHYEVSGQVQGTSTSTEADKITNPHIVYSKHYVVVNDSFESTKKERLIDVEEVSKKVRVPKEVGGLPSDELSTLETGWRLPFDDVLFGTCNNARDSKNIPVAVVVRQGAPIVPKKRKLVLVAKKATPLMSAKGRPVKKARAVGTAKQDIPAKTARAAGMAKQGVPIGVEAVSTKVSVPKEVGGLPSDELSTLETSWRLPFDDVLLGVCGNACEDQPSQHLNDVSSRVPYERLGSIEWDSTIKK